MWIIWNSLSSLWAVAIQLQTMLLNHLLRSNISITLLQHNTQIIWLIQLLTTKILLKSTILNNNNLTPNHQFLFFLIETVSSLRRILAFLNNSFRCLNSNSWYMDNSNNPNNHNFSKLIHIVSNWCYSNNIGEPNQCKPRIPCSFILK